MTDRGRCKGDARRSKPYSSIGPDAALLAREQGLLASVRMGRRSLVSTDLLQLSVV